MLKLFNVLRAKERAEQSFNLKKMFADRHGKPEGKITIKSFCFGPEVNYWTRFTLFVLVDCAIYVICPVVPIGCMIETSLITRMGECIATKRKQERSATVIRALDEQLRWLALVTSQPADSTSSSIVDLEGAQYTRLRHQDTLKPTFYGPVVEFSESSLHSIHSIAPITIHEDLEPLPGSTPLVPFNVLAILKTGLIHVTLACQDTIPTFESTHLIQTKDNESFELNKFECLDLTLAKSYQSPSSKIYSYLDFTYPSVVRDPLCLNRPDKYDGSDLATCNSELIALVDTTTTQLDRPNPVISLGIYYNSRVGNYMVALPSKSSRGILFDMEGLSAKSVASRRGKKEATPENLKHFVSPLEKIINMAPVSIPRISIPANLSPMETLQTIITIKQNIFKFQQAHVFLESSIRSRNYNKGA
eukprot:gene8668-10177_t